MSIEKLYLIRAMSTSKTQYLGLNSIGTTWVEKFGDSWMYSNAGLADKTFDETIAAVWTMSEELRLQVFDGPTVAFDLLELSVTNKSALLFGEQPHYGQSADAMTVSGVSVKNCLVDVGPIFSTDVVEEDNNPSNK